MDEATRDWLIKWRLLGSPRQFMPEQVEFFGRLPESAFDHVPQNVAVQFLWFVGDRPLDGRQQQISVALARRLVTSTYPAQPDRFGGGKYYFTGSVDGLPTQHATLTALLKKLARDLQLRQRAADPPELVARTKEFASVVAQREAP